MSSQNFEVVFDKSLNSSLLIVTNDWRWFSRQYNNRIYNLQKWWYKPGDIDREYTLWCYISRVLNYIYQSKLHRNSWLCSYITVTVVGPLWRVRRADEFYSMSQSWTVDVYDSNTALMCQRDKHDHKNYFIYLLVLNCSKTPTTKSSIR